MEHGQAFHQATAGSPPNPGSIFVAEEKRICNKPSPITLACLFVLAILTAIEIGITHALSVA